MATLSRDFFSKYPALICYGTSTGIPGYEIFIDINHPSYRETIEALYSIFVVIEIYYTCSDLESIINERYYYGMPDDIQRVNREQIEPIVKRDRREIAASWINKLQSFTYYEHSSADHDFYR